VLRRSAGLLAVADPWEYSVDIDTTIRLSSIALVL
jgi:hypothetical protein